MFEAWNVDRSIVNFSEDFCNLNDHATQTQSARKGVFCLKPHTPYSTYSLYMKKSFLKIMAWSTVALIIPLLGNQFVEGWNWNVGDFLFAWVFFVVMSTTIRLVTKVVPNKKYRMVVGVIVFLPFLFLWVMLATG